ncbi:MAG: hypothetical protein JXR83_14580 [Deltaproteobacteria bacterium]|nr:hypothetical protein [Deltaproteobacteria bacterium]
MRWLMSGAGAAVVLAASLLTGCLTFETTLPGTLDLRGALAQPQDAPLEPKRGAFADGGDSYNEGMVFTESTDKPTTGEYVVPKEPVSGQFVTPAAPAGSTVYRRVLRQWFILGLIPILANPDNVTSDLRTELSKPGAKATHIRISSGADLLDLGRMVVGIILSPIAIGGLLQAVPTRTTEVIAYVMTAPETTAPAPVAAPVPPDTPAAPETPAPIDTGAMKKAPPANPGAPDKPVTQ